MPGDGLRWFLISESHSKDYIPTIMLRGHERETENSRTGSLFANYSVFCVSKEREHLKSHMKNLCDWYHGAWFSGVVAKCVYLIGFS